MMKYPLTTANGDAGEFFAAYKIAKELGWPCRLFDIDIGIDAQVEILTDTRESTGRHVALQIKATSDKKVNCRYVTSRQLKYWKSLEIPVFVVLVDLQNEVMFLHLVNPQCEYEKTSNGTYKILFNLKKDRFTSASASIFIEASERIAMVHINNYLNPIKEATDEILEAVKQNQKGNGNPHDLIEYMESRANLFELIGKAKAASAVSKVGEAVISKCQDKLYSVLSDLQEEMDFMKDNWIDVADIRSFLGEKYASRPKI